MHRIIFGYVLLIAVCSSASVSRRKSLYEAVLHNDIFWVNKFLDQDRNIDIKDEKGKTILSLASKNGYIKIVALLLEKGSSANIDIQLFHAIQIAAQKGHSKTVKLLLNSYKDKRTGFLHINEILNREISQQSKDKTSQVIKTLLGGISGRDKDKIFFELMDENRLGLMSELIKNGAKPTHIGDFLIRAVSKGRMDILTLFFENGVDPNSGDRGINKTPLMEAAQLGNSKMVNMLLSKGADVHLQNARGGSVLLYGVYGNDAPTVKMLLNKGARINPKKNKAILSSLSPLQAAIEKGNPEMIDLLFDSGLKENISNKYVHGNTLLHIAVRKGNFDTVEKLLQDKEIGINEPNNNGLTPLHIACKLGFIDIVKVLIEKGAKIGLVSNNGSTPLFYSVSSGNFDITKLLLSLEANPNRWVRLGSSNKEYYTTILITAVQRGNLPSVKELVASGANINEREGENQQTALIVASQSGNSEMVRFLLKNGANPNLISKQGMTAMHYASLGGHFGILKILIDKGININERGGENRQTALIVASQSGNSEMVRFLLENGANPNLMSKKGMTAMHYASLGGHLAILKMLIDKGINLNERANNGYTALHFIINSNIVKSHKKFEIVKLLLLNQAIINLKDRLSGHTPLHMAAIKGLLPVMELLISYGADLYITSNQGKIPLDLAYEKKNKEIITFFFNLLLPNFKGNGKIIAKNDANTDENYFSTTGISEGEIDKKDLPLLLLEIHREKRKPNVYFPNAENARFEKLVIFDTGKDLSKYKDTLSRFSRGRHMHKLFQFLPQPANRNFILDIPGTNIVLTFFFKITDSGNGDNVIIFWEKSGKKIQFKGMIDIIIPSSFGNASFSSIHPIDENEYIIIGETKGAKGKEKWGSVWVGYWRMFHSLRMISKERYSSRVMDKEQKIEYKFDKDKKVITFIKKESRFKKIENNQEIYSDWSVISTKKVYLENDVIRLKRYE